MAAALKILLSPEPAQAAPPAKRGSSSGTFPIVRVEPRAGKRHPGTLAPRVRAGDEERLAPAFWFGQAELA